MLIPRNFSPILILTVALSSCVTNETPKVTENIYKSLPLSETNAQLVGSSIKAPGLLAATYLGYITSVDGYSILDPVRNWNRPIVITPGSHEIVGEYRQSLYHAEVTLHFTAEAGSSYQFNIEPLLSVDGSNDYCEFSITNTLTGKVVSAVVQKSISGELRRSPYSTSNLK